MCTGMFFQEVQFLGFFAKIRNSCGLSSWKKFKLLQNKWLLNGLIETRMRLDLQIALSIQAPFILPWQS